MSYRPKTEVTVMNDAGTVEKWTVTAPGGKAEDWICFEQSPGVWLCILAADSMQGRKAMARWRSTVRSA